MDGLSKIAQKLNHCIENGSSLESLVAKDMIAQDIAQKYPHISSLDKGSFQFMIEDYWLNRTN